MGDFVFAATVGSLQTDFCPSFDSRTAAPESEDIGPTILGVRLTMHSLGVRYPNQFPARLKRRICKNFKLFFFVLPLSEKKWQLLVEQISRSPVAKKKICDEKTNRVRTRTKSSIFNFLAMLYFLSVWHPRAHFFNN